MHFHRDHGAVLCNIRCFDDDVLALAGVLHASAFQRFGEGFCIERNFVPLRRQRLQRFQHADYHSRAERRASSQKQSA